MNTIDRINDLTIETAQTWLEGSAQLQKQNAQLVQTWLNTVDAAQQTNRELVTRFVKQAQQGQALWLQLFQESVRNGLDTFAQATRTQAQNVAETLTKASQQAAGAEKRTAASVNAK
jgi:regulator of PEP synthase PpsR (kinase-PPPase family)